MVMCAIKMRVEEAGVPNKTQLCHILQNEQAFKRTAKQQHLPRLPSEETGGRLCPAPGWGAAAAGLRAQERSHGESGGQGRAGCLRGEAPCGGETLAQKGPEEGGAPWKSAESGAGVGSAGVRRGGGGTRPRSHAAAHSDTRTPSTPPAAFHTPPTPQPLAPGRPCPTANPPSSHGAALPAVGIAASGNFRRTSGTQQGPGAPQA